MALDILLVEDNPGDVRLTQEAIASTRLAHSTLWTACDGVDALDFLRGRGAYDTKHHPDLILLDLNLPRKDGREVLRDIKSDPDLRRIPVVVLSSSQSPDDISLAYDLHANCYVTKPLGFDEFEQAVRAIEHFWMTVVQRPTKGLTAE